MLKLHQIVLDVPLPTQNFATTTITACHNLGTFVKVVEGTGPKEATYATFRSVVVVAKVDDLGHQSDRTKRARAMLAIRLALVGLVPTRAICHTTDPRGH